MKLIIRTRGWLYVERHIENIKIIGSSALVRTFYFVCDHDKQLRNQRYFKVIRKRRLHSILKEYTDDRIHHHLNSLARFLVYKRDR